MLPFDHSLPIDDISDWSESFLKHLFFFFWKVEIFRIIKIAFRIQVGTRSVWFCCFGHVWHNRIMCFYNFFFFLFENFGWYIKLKDKNESQLQLLETKFLIKYLLPLFIVLMIKISSAELFQAPFTRSKLVKSLYFLCFLVNIIKNCGRSEI